MGKIFQIGDMISQILYQKSELSVSCPLKTNRKETLSGNEKSLIMDVLTQLGFWTLK